MPHQLETLSDVEDPGVGNGPHDRVRGHGANQSINSIASPGYVLTDIEYAWCRAQWVPFREERHAVQEVPLPRAGRRIKASHFDQRDVGQPLREVINQILVGDARPQQL